MSHTYEHEYDSDETVIDEDILIPRTSYDELNATVDMSQADDVINRLFSASFPGKDESNGKNINEVQFRGIKLSPTIQALLEIDKLFSATPHKLPCHQVVTNSRLHETQELNNQKLSVNMPQISNVSYASYVGKSSSSLLNLGNDRNIQRNQSAPTTPKANLIANFTDSLEVKNNKKRPSSEFNEKEKSNSKLPQHPNNQQKNKASKPPPTKPAPATTPTNSTTNRAEITDVTELIRILSRCHIRPNTEYLATNFKYSELCLLLARCGDFVSLKSNYSVHDLAKKLSWFIKTGSFVELRERFICESNE